MKGALGADTIQRDTMRFVHRFVDLDNSVKFTAKDSLVFFGSNNANMYGESQVTYGEIDLKAM